jgi:CheY-like chemotaxis protein
LPTVLVVDDEPAVADAIAEQVREIGYLAVVALDAHTAIQIAASSPPDIVLTDIYMSDMDGYELIRAIRANGIPVRIIAMSGGQEGFDTLMIAEKLGARQAFPSGGSRRSHRPLSQPTGRSWSVSTDPRIERCGVAQKQNARPTERRAPEC